jgi:two-component system cell cycle response regulator
MDGRHRSARKGSRGARREKEVAVLARGDSVLRFLGPFFNGCRIYRPAYYQKADIFLKNLSETPPAAAIIEGAFLRTVVDKITKTPTVAVISGETKKGIENVISHHIKHYLYRPYVVRDLEYKLESAILEKYTLEKLGEEMKELETLVAFSQIVSSTLDPKELLDRIVRKIAEVIPVTRCSMIRVDWIHRSAFVVASFEDPRISGMKLSLRKYPEIVEALTSKKPVVIKDISTDPIMAGVKKIIEPLGIRSILVIPVFFRDKVIGTLFLRTSRTHAFSRNEIRLLNTITAASANALYNAFLFEQVEDEKSRLEKLAVTDYLTGIYNVRYFSHRIVEEFSRALRYGLSISCLMLDIDYFKKVNDVYGHRTGDKVLKEFAQLLKNRSRKSDVLARYGGEEFILLLPQTPHEGAIREAERLRECVRSHSFRSLRNKGGLTVSVGVAAFPHSAAKTHDDLISFADHALFTAKKSGRDRVTVYGR